MSDSHSLPPDESQPPPPRCCKCGLALDADGWCHYCAVRRQKSWLSAMFFAVPALGYLSCGFSLSLLNSIPSLGAFFYLMGIVMFFVGPILGAIYYYCFNPKDF